MTQQWNYPLYAATVTSELSLRLLGGPFYDVDDALDCLWDLISSDEISRNGLLLIETGASQPKAIPLPNEALPAA